MALTYARKKAIEIRDAYTPLSALRLKDTPVSYWVERIGQLITVHTYKFHNSERTTYRRQLMSVIDTLKVNGKEYGIHPEALCLYPKGNLPLIAENHVASIRKQATTPFTLKAILPRKPTRRATANRVSTPEGFRPMPLVAMYYRIRKSTPRDLSSNPLCHTHVAQLINENAKEFSLFFTQDVSIRGVAYRLRGDELYPLESLPSTTRLKILV